MDKHAEGALARAAVSTASTPLKRVERQLAVELLLLERKLAPEGADTPDRQAALRIYLDAVDRYCRVRELLNGPPPGARRDPGSAR
jgi:hypothetical protein